MANNSIIAVDGYSSSGKSTFARTIAAELDYVYIDSGAMYRAVTLYCIENGILQDGVLDQNKLKDSLNHIQIAFPLDPENKKQITLLNNVNVEEKIRGIAVSATVSKISQVKEVRKKMVSLQRHIAEQGGVVMDGRDIGTVVFPEAGLKIFMNARAPVRAKRRYDELVQKGLKVSYDEVLENIRMRDREDENRTESPLRKASDAVELDNSNMTLEEQMHWFSVIWERKKSGHED